MHNTIEHLPNLPEYIAFLHGPIVLGAKTGTEDLKGLLADDSRWGQIPSGKKLPIDQAPIIIEDNPSKIADELVPAEGRIHAFYRSGYENDQSGSGSFSTFLPDTGCAVHDILDGIIHAQYRSYLDSLGKNEKEKLKLQKRTIDFVAPGEQQPEEDHEMQNENSHTGSSNDLFWRDAENGGYFSYNLSTNKETGLSLIVSYWGAEWGARKFDIYIDDVKLMTVDNTGRWNQSKIFEVNYSIPDSMIKDKDHVRIKFQALQGNTAGAVYYLRLVRKVNIPN